MSAWLWKEQWCRILRWPTVVGCQVHLQSSHVQRFLCEVLWQVGSGCIWWVTVPSAFWLLLVWGWFHRMQASLEIPIQCIWCHCYDRRCKVGIAAEPLCGKSNCDSSAGVIYSMVNSTQFDAELTNDWSLSSLVMMSISQKGELYFTNQLPALFTTIFS